ncbi:MAG TPA: methionine--tRNA ligase [Patescibacteria group bacterium]|nr:methionine--tRNA ligase [Patescibacteria group bacterium]
MAKYYVTTAIPYVNAEPHIGFAMELITADVLARRASLAGSEVIFSTGTDEHGGKISDKAKESGQSTKEFADEVSQKFRDLCKLLNVTNNRFIRTTDLGHKQRSQLIWNNLAKDIYKGKYKGWYCTGDEAFFSEAEVKANKGICPTHNKPYDKIEEENYFFKLSKYQDSIVKAIESDELLIIPSSRKKEILNVIKSGLEDISVSRPKEKIAWGIPVPKDNTQVMYVWFEALMNYITVLGYPENKDFQTFWPADTHVIGKDIIRFHAAIWPAMLMSLGIALPKRIYVHGFITVDGKKMSKSLGNVIHPSDLIKQFGVDAFRYYFLRHIPSYDDGDYSIEKFIAAYNGELANELGNAVQRTAAMIGRYQAGKIGELPPSGHDMAGYEAAMDNCHFDRALDEIWEHIRGLNQNIDEEKPWELAKAKDNDHLREVLAYQVSSLLFIAELLEPFLPDTSEYISQLFSSGEIKGDPKILFPKFDDKNKVPAVVK